MKTRLTSLLLLITLMKVSFGQELPELVPLSPEASAFEEYANTPVNLYKGAPEISIPIFTASVNQISLPVSLTYDASGILVSQIASTVGLGWNLNHGGMVTRKVNGLPDQSTDNYTKINSQDVNNLLSFYNGGNSVSIAATTSEDRNRIINMISDHENANIDLEADTFNFSVNDLSGTILMDYAGNKAYCLEHPDLLIQFTEQSNDILKWDITDKNGIKYVFSKKERTNANFSSLSNEYIYEYTSAWHLTEIINNNNSIELTYDNGGFWANEPLFDNDVKETEIKPDCNPGATLSVITTNLNSDSNIYQISQPYFSSIKVNGETVLTTSYTSGRLDLTGRNKLETISILSKGNTIKTYKFVQSYFNTPVAIQSTVSERNYRLKLDELRIYNNQYNTANEDYHSYLFSYIDENDLPPRDSASQDYWGYYNGSGHSSMIAGNTDEMDNLRTLSARGLYTDNGANRKVSIDHVKKGTLNKITYPTGGSSEYFYQEHTGAEYIYSGTVTPTEDFPVFIGGLEPNATPQEIEDFIHYPNGSACDDIQLGGVPKTAHISIDIATEDLDRWSTFNLGVITRSGAGLNGLPNTGYTEFDKYYIYKSSSAKTYCELRDMDLYGDANLVDSGNPYNTLEVKHRFSQTGRYYITMISNKDRTYQWKMKRTPRRVEYKKQDKIGGLRVFKIETKPNTSENGKLTTLYYYNHASALFDEYDLNVQKHNQQIQESFLQVFDSLYNVVDANHSSFSIHSFFPVPTYKIEVSHGVYVYLQENADGVRVSTADVTYTPYTPPGAPFTLEDVTILANHVPLTDGNDPDITWVPFDILKAHIEAETNPFSQGPGAPPSFYDWLEPKIIDQDSTSAIAHQKLRFNKMVSGTNYNHLCGSVDEGGLWAGWSQWGVGLYRYYYEKYQQHSYNLAPKTKHNVAYSSVSEIQVDGSGMNGFTVYNFYNQDEGSFTENQPTYNVNLNGNPFSVKHYDKNNNIMKSTYNVHSKHFLEGRTNGYYLELKSTHYDVCSKYYSSDGYFRYGYELGEISPGNPLLYNCVGPGSKTTYNEYLINKYDIARYWSRLDSTVEYTYNTDGTIATSTTYKYKDLLDPSDPEYDLSATHYQPIEVVATTSNGETVHTLTQYPQDLSSPTSAEQVLINQHRIAAPIKVETVTKDSGGTVLATQTLVTQYKDWGSQQILPEIIKTSKGAGASLQNRVAYKDYDGNDNPLEVSKPNGIPITYIWGYNLRHPIAKIENATNSDVTTAIGTLNAAYDTLAELQALSNADDDTCTDAQSCDEKELRTALAALRNALPNAMVTTYTYDPFIGVTSITDPSGRTAYYSYDDFNRLKDVQDQDGYLISENEYNYRP